MTPCPNGGMLYWKEYPVTDAPPTEKKPRSKRIYIYWGVALTLLLTAGLLCWTVVVPMWRTRKAVVAIQRSWKTATDRALIWDSDEEPVLCRYVAELGGCEEAARRLSAYLNAPDFLAPHKEVALELLGRCEGQGMPPLVAALRSDRVLYRRSAARSLFYVALREIHHQPGDLDIWKPRPTSSIGFRASREAVDSLAGALDDKDQSVRAWAVMALGQIGPEAVSAVPALVGVIEGSSSMHAGVDHGGFPGYVLHQDRSIAARALAYIAPTHPAVLPALEKALKDPEESVRAAAAEALKKIKAAQEKPR